MARLPEASFGAIWFRAELTIHEYPQICEDTIEAEAKAGRELEASTARQFRSRYEFSGPPPQVRNRKLGLGPPELAKYFAAVLLFGPQNQS
jgi:hypothetical protein